MSPGLSWMGYKSGLALGGGSNQHMVNHDDKEVWSQNVSLQDSRGYLKTIGQHSIYHDYTSGVVVQHSDGFYHGIWDAVVSQT